MDFDPSKLLGFIPEQERTEAQKEAHAAAVGVLPKFASFGLPTPQLAKGDRVCLWSFWKEPEVVADVGFVFSRFYQYTGSCVGVGGGNALFSTIAAQRCASENPTKAFLPFWPSAYGMSRHYMGSDGQGEGSLGSTFAKALKQDGITDWPNGNDPDSLPDYKQSDVDGIRITAQEEYKWSSFRNSDLQKILPKTRQHLLGNATEANSVEDIRALTLNGYGVSFACSRYIGNGRIMGSGTDACVVGSWDTRGGHQQSIHGFWEHPTLGPLYLALNSWPASVYPRDPNNFAPVCSTWVKEADVQAALRYQAEVFGFSHLDWFPAQPKVLDWIF